MMTDTLPLSSIALLLSSNVFLNLQNLQVENDIFFML